jgi:hypothetical protein
MQRFPKIVSGMCSAAIALAPAAATVAAAALATEEPWEIVPEESLRDLRGGLDLGSLVANFAIQRVVEIDGVVVARMQIVITNLDRLSSGGMPTITVTGPIAEIVQFMQTPGNVSLAGAASTVVTKPAASTVPSSASASSASAPAASLPMRQAAISPAAPSTATSGAAVASSPSAVTGPSITSSGGNTGAVSATGTQSGSMAQMGSALATAVAAASGTLPQSGSSTAPSAAAASRSPSVAAVTPSVAAATTSASPTTNSPASLSPVSPPANPAGTATTAGTTQTIPIGTAGQVVVLNNLPNAAAITTAVQNSVHAATIQTQTTISATLNSMAFLNAFTLANSIRQQVATGL